MVKVLKSKWFPWALVSVLVVALLLFKSTLQTTRKEVETSRKETERLGFELAQAEWSLKQERSKVTVREERKPDGTVIVERQEEVQKKSNQTKKVQQKVEVKREVVVKEKIVEVTAPLPRYGLGLGVAVPAELPPDKYDYTLQGDIRLFGPWFLQGTMQLDGQTFTPNQFGLGVRWEF
jgi:hypothetical protein